MKTLTGTFQHGQVVLDGPADWPEGCRVAVEPLPAEAPESAEAIEDWLCWYRALEPLEFTPEEELAVPADQPSRYTDSTGGTP
jgi:hypothetical protein